MKNTFFLIVTTLAVLSFSTIYAQGGKGTAQARQQLTKIMQDSSMVKMLMESIASDDHMRGMMMNEMMKACKTDTSKMMGMCKMMMQNEGAHKMMMQMMGPEKKAGATDNASEILVKFKQGVKDSQITAMSTNIGLQQIKEIKQLRLRVFRITSGKSVQDVIKACQKEPFIEYAEPNQTYQTKK